ncbi:MAG TPA: tetratricopeptide repeat protein [Polyangiaceae bacterium]
MRDRSLLTCCTLAVALLASACAHEAPLPPKAVLLNAAGAQALARGDLESAEASLAVAIEYSPRFVEAWVNLGYVELRRGNFDQARRDFLKARALNRDLPAPHHGLGVLAEAQGDGPAAEAFYRDALKVDPGFGPARANLARRLFGRGQYENAREQFQRLREVEPGAAEGWAGEAEALLRLDREAEAEAIVSAGRMHAGDAPSLLLVLARLRLAAGAWDEAEAILAPLTGIDDRAKAGAAWSWIAVARAGRGDAPGSLEAARAALAVDRDDPVARYALALSAGTGTPSR